MFRSDKKQHDKQATNETSGNQIPSPTWQHSAPPVEQPATPVAAPVQPPTQPRAIGERDAMARDIKDGVLNGFVGSGTVMAGEAVFKGMLRVDGNLTGRVTSEDGTLLVGTNGQVDANVKVSVATIHGTVNGDIVATKRIELGRSAKVVGNIQTPALVIEQGAVFEGSCRMLPSGKEKNREKAKESSPTLIAPTGDLSELSDISEIAS
jgi:cytoskeletal protein CcmA (bactofilin family)